MNKLQKEYNEFGPWLCEIIDESDITHEFEDYKDEILSCNLAFKVPMDKEWRTVEKGELLYNSIITISDQGIGYYVIINGAAFSSHIKFGDIVYIRLTEEMLYCNMEIGTHAEKLHFQYLPSPIVLANQFISELNSRFESTHGQSIVNVKNKRTMLKYISQSGFSDAKVDELLTV